MSKKTLLAAGLSGLAALLCASVALAAGDASWLGDATSVIDDAGAGLQKLGYAIIGLTVIATGILIAVIGKTDFGRISSIVLGGLLVSFGAAWATGLLGSGS
jgi:hypothetical protein